MCQQLQIVEPVPRTVCMLDIDTQVNFKKKLSLYLYAFVFFGKTPGIPDFDEGVLELLRSVTRLSRSSQDSM